MSLSRGRSAYMAKNQTNAIKDSVASGLHGVSGNMPDVFNASLNFDFKAEQRHSLW